MRLAAGLSIAAGIVIATAVGGKILCDKFTVALPNYPPGGKVVWLEQNWTPPQRSWFHHADQGTLTFGIPYEWFAALEQPALSFGPPRLLSDPSYLDRYGFIADPDDSSGLPVGFAHGGPIVAPSGDPWRNPQTSHPMTGVGLTCAACHTGRLTVENGDSTTTILIDGAPALTDLDKFRNGVGLSLYYTRWWPFRFDRFAERILGPGASDDAKSALLKQLDQVLAEVDAFHKLEDGVKSQSVEEGFARLDALNRIGNFVFAIDLQDPGNYAPTAAPVHFPRIWDASWFAWVQYNGSIGQPMVRNAGEALGVSAPLNLTGGPHDLFASGVQVKTIFALEQLLAGKAPDASHGFQGLRPPQWPVGILPPIDQPLAAKGAVLYQQLCQSCHMAPVTNAAFWTSDRWTAPNAAGQRYLDLELIATKHIGTDPAQAADMRNRKVTLPASLGIDSDQFGPALGQTVEKTVNYWYDHQQPPVPDALRQQMDGFRDNGIRAPMAYKVRPLDGIWATPPYLHNGSVPTLYALLSPVSERPTTFYLGNRVYDPVNVGYVTDPLRGGFKFDTTIPGNSNAGHEFNDGPEKNGVIGRKLSPDERRALIEYLKTL